MAKPAPETVPNPPARKVGLAPGSGSARGLARSGVLRAIEEAGIKVDRAEEIIEIGYRSAAEQLAHWAGAPTDE